MKVSIIIPVRNEERRVGKTLEKYGKFFTDLKKKGVLDFEFVTVLNACEDNSFNVIKNAQKKFKEIKILNFKEGGKGFAIMEGFKDSLKRENDVIGFADADGSTSHEAYYDLIKNINNYDGIIASRYVKGSKVFPKQSFSRIVASRIFNFLIHSLFIMFYKDTQCGAKLFKYEVIKKILPSLTLTRWAFDVNLLYLCKKHGFKIREYPVIWRDEEYSVLNLKKAGLQMFLSIIRLRLLNSPFKFIIKLYDKLPEKLKVHHKA